MNERATSEGITPLRERRLIEQCQRGCAESAHELIAAHQNRLYAFVWRMVRRDHDAEEICQDAFLRAFQSLDGFNFSYRFSTWLFTIAYRLCLNLMRRRKDYSGETDFSLADSDGRNPESDNIFDGIANSDEARRLREIIWNSVDELTPHQRAAVLLFYRESLSCQEIGDILEMPAATVKSHLHRARSRLKEKLEGQLATDWNGVRFGEAESA
ncbi:MAG: sigma-70 family RNA polymerase sigma factor [Phycisphaerae bacterium]|nr:sigma-70 family RNA polymerase sigma factor [Phycisphaerae bacterium]